MAETQREGAVRRKPDLSVEVERYRSMLQALETREANLRLFTRSLAHDFNNLLSGILGHAGLIIQSSENASEINDSASVILKAAGRARELVTQLLDTTREQISANAAVDLHETIREVADLLRGTASPSIHIGLRLDAPESLITGDAGPLHHMLLNLALNARDAMPEGGELTFSTRSLPTEPPSIEIAVSDTGTGIAPELRDRIFDPLFTTKSERNGTGMGLAIVQRVVQAHGGSVSLTSSVGNGATFTIVLPLRRAAPKSVAATA